MDGYLQAVRVAGSKAALARALGVRVESLYSWERSGRVPAERVIQLYRLTGVTPHALRPDLYPDPCDGVSRGPA
jgi:DNA-binding transcriptional regulator YdaS (Cro superfamily)